MNLRFGAIAALLFVSIYCFASPPDKEAPGQNKNSIKALFDGIPADLRTKVKSNPIRIDRANDWVQANVTDKGKTVEMQMGIKKVYCPARAMDGTYKVRLSLEPTKVNVLGDEWPVTLDRFTPPGWAFSFVGVSMADAEKLLDSKTAVIQGKVKRAILLGRPGSDGPNGSSFGTPTILLILEDVHVNGKKWAPAPVPAPDPPPMGGGFGKGKKGPPGEKR